MKPKSRTIKDILALAGDYFSRKQIDSPRLTAEILLSHALNVNRVTLYMNLEQPLNESEISGFRELVRRRAGREPIQYITGVQEFWSLDFSVDTRVLIPRPETEHLIELAIKQAAELSARDKSNLRVLDMGTGCGVLAVVLARELQNVRIWATDISSGALEVARLNAEKHGVADAITFIQGDLWQPLRDMGITFDIIVSNPPYVSARDYSHLPPEIQEYEPVEALLAEDDGFYHIRELIEGSTAFLTPGGWLLMEMAPVQTARALKIIGRMPAFRESRRIKDYSRRYRVVSARLA
ncbi:MAG: peptide chain release factor N(5)-glutamine methyltransferase [Deltaproteobacteria bacterium]|nr:MAG: peptide chain release factor N(5)-glutamine methyltransferase [Deltaproteobacteria bacterium]